MTFASPKKCCGKQHACVTLKKVKNKKKTWFAVGFILLNIHRAPCLSIITAYVCLNSFFCCVFFKTSPLIDYQWFSREYKHDDDIFFNLYTLHTFVYMFFFNFAHTYIIYVFISSLIVQVICNISRLCLQQIHYHNYIRYIILRISD